MAMPDGSVILVEIARQTLSRVTPDGKVHVIAAPRRRAERRGHGPGRQDLRHQQRRLRLDGCGRASCSRSRRRTTTRAAASRSSIPRRGKFETLYDACDGRRLRGPNDLVFDGAGGFWFTDLGKTRERDADRGAVYYAKADGSRIEEAIFPLERPNGIGLSPGRQDALRGRDADGPLLVVPALRPRAASSRRMGRTAARRARSSSGSAATRCSTRSPWTTDGHICVATLITGAVSDIWPDGSQVDQYKLPDMMVTNVCFGGPELRTAFATLVDGRHARVVRVAAAGPAASPPEPVARVAA